MLSRASTSVGPLYHPRFGDFSIILSPCHPEIGTNGMVVGLYPIFFKNIDNSF